MTLVRLWLLLVLFFSVVGWTRPDFHEPVILIEKLGCEQYEWDAPCETLMVQNGFEGWQKSMTTAEVNALVDSMFLTYCHPELAVSMRAGIWTGTVTTPVDPFGGQAPHFKPRMWEVRCGG